MAIIIKQKKTEQEESLEQWKGSAPYSRHKHMPWSECEVKVCGK